MNATNTTAASPATPVQPWLLVAVDSATGAIVGHTTLPLHDCVSGSVGTSAESKRKVERLYTQINSALFAHLLVGAPERGRTFALDATPIAVFDFPSSARRTTGRRLRGPQRYLTRQRQRRAQARSGGQQ